jgi:hypothetical protein
MSSWKRLFALALLIISATALRSSPSVAQCVQSPMAGAWVSVNSATRGLTRAQVQVGCCDQVATVCRCVHRRTACTSSGAVIRAIVIGEQ